MILEQEQAGSAEPCYPRALTCFKLLTQTIQSTFPHQATTVHWQDEDDALRAESEKTWKKKKENVNEQIRILTEH